MLLCISRSSNYLFFFFLNRQPPLPLPTWQLYINLEFSVWLFFPVTWNFLEVNSEEKCLYSPTLLTLGWRRVFPSDCWYNVKYWQFNGPVTWYVPWRKFGSVVSQLQMSVAFVNRPSRMRIRMLKKKKKEKKKLLRACWHWSVSSLENVLFLYTSLGKMFYVRRTDIPPQKFFCR